MTHEERRQLFHEARTQPAPLILIVASLVSAAARSLVSTSGSLRPRESPPS